MFVNITTILSLKENLCPFSKAEILCHIDNKYTIAENITWPKAVNKIFKTLKTIYLSNA